MVESLLPLSFFSLLGFWPAVFANKYLRFNYALVLVIYMAWLSVRADGVASSVVMAGLCLAMLLSGDHLQHCSSALKLQQPLKPIQKPPFSLSTVFTFLTQRPSRLWRHLTLVRLGFYLRLGGVLLLFAVGLGLVGGGQAWQLLPPVRLGQAQVDWVWRFKLFNALIGIGLIIWFYRPVKLHARGVLAVIVISVGVIALALVVGGWQNIWRWEPKLPAIWPWLALFMFFRYCIQAPLFRRLGAVSITATACVFGLVHIGGGFIYACLAAVAGFGYGFIWYKYQNIALCCACHWLVNIMHFTLLTYPF